MSVSTAFAGPARAGAADRIRVLEADPDLARGIRDAGRRTQAVQQATACAGLINTGPWTPKLGGDLDGVIGLLVLNGLLTRTVRVRRQAATELIGPGDLLRPWQDDGGSGLLPSDWEWQALGPTRIAILDRAFATSLAAWPEVTAELYARALRRSRWQCITAAICRLRRVDERILAFLWHLADRWGRVTPEGIVVPVALTHAQIAGLVGAQRPSVTTALVALRTRGLVERRSDRTWVVTNAARAELDPAGATEFAA